MQVHLVEASSVPSSPMAMADTHVGLAFANRTSLTCSILSGGARPATLPAPGVPVASATRHMPMLSPTSTKTNVPPQRSPFSASVLSASAVFAACTKGTSPELRTCLSCRDPFGSFTRAFTAGFAEAAMAAGGGGPPRGRPRVEPRQRPPP